MSHAVRNHLQGIRGLAVAAVVLFHFFPSLLPFGFLGVDVFFVLSGFLISLVLSRSQPSLSSLPSFYFKRFRRIFPLFLLVCLLLLLYIDVFRSDESLFYSTRAALSAIAFATNLKLKDQDEDYFTSLEKATDLFTHTWSLSVEIQFYLVAPIIVFGSATVLGAHSRPFPIYVFIFTLSLLRFALLPPEEAFNSTAARLWQFAIGMTAFEIESSLIPVPHVEDGRKDADARGVSSICGDLIAILVILAGTIASVVFQSSFLGRISVSLLTGFTIVRGSSLPFLSSSYLVYLGDISYSLYLIHWPIVCLLHELELSNLYVRISAMIVCAVLAAVSYEFFENWYRNLDITSTGILVTLLYLACFMLIILSPDNYLRRLPIELQLGTDFARFIDDEPLRSVEDTLRLWQLEDRRNISIEEALAINDEADRLSGKNLEFPACVKRKWNAHCQVQKGNGSLRFAIIGNSYAPNLGHPIVKHFRPYYSTISMFAVTSCGALQNVTYLTPSMEPRDCVFAGSMFEKEVATVRPDVLFIVERFLDADSLFNETSPTDKDTVIMKQRLDIFSKYAKKIFIMQAIPKTKSAFIGKAMRARLAAGIPLDGEMKASRFTRETIELEGTHARARLRHVARACTNCVLFDLYNRHLDKNGKYMVIHPRTFISYFEIYQHYTQYGLRLVEPLFQRLAQSFDQLMLSDNTNNVLEWTER